MKKFTKAVALVVALTLSPLGLYAQQWSDVGNPGFSPSAPTTLTSARVASMEIYNGVPYALVYLSDASLSLMSYTGGAWNTLASPASGVNASSAHMAIDAAGVVYIAYYSVGSNSTFAKKFNGTSWSTVGAANFASNNDVHGLLIDPSTNFPVITTRISTGAFTLSVYRFNGTSWSLVGPAGFSTGTNYARSAISSTGTPYVLFDHLNGKFSVMKYDGSNWVFVGLSQFGSSSLGVAGTDIVVDASGAPHVIVQNATDSKVSVLKYNGTNWVNVGLADFTPGAANYGRLAINNTGTLHIVYQDGTNGNKLSAMKFNGTAWVAVGAQGFTGGGAQYPSLDFDTAGIPYVMYHDALITNKRLTAMKLCTSNTATVGSTTPGSVCTAGAVTLAATSSGTLKWYNAATNGLYVATGTSYTTPSISTTSTYSVAAYDANGCSSPRTAVVATVTPLPTVTTSSGNVRCGPGTVSLSATPSAGSIQWFSTSTGGSALSTGTSFTSPSISNTTTYYAEAVNNGCSSSSRTSVLATVHAIPANPVAVNNGRCGPGTVSVSVTSDPGTVQWFSAASGGTLLQASGSTYATPSISTSTTYYANVTSPSGCVSPGRTAVTASINSIPTITSSTPGNRCGEGSVNLVVTTSGDASARWYNGLTGGSPIGTAKTLPTPSITTTTTFYAEALENGCPSTARTAVVATIKPFPTVSSSDVSRCDAGTVTFEASSAGAISWFAALTGGSALGTGPNYTTPSISVTTPYFIGATLDGCTTPTRTQVSAIINATPPQPTITQNNSNIEAPVLTSSSSSGNQWFKDDVAMGTAITNTHTILEEGSYKVQVTLNGCVSPFSNAVSYVITGFETPAKDLLQLFPNPTADELVINLKGFERDRLVSVSVIDLFGRPMMESLGMGGDELHFDVRSYQQGQYIVLARQGVRKATRTFIKSR